MRRLALCVVFAGLFVADGCLPALALSPEEWSNFVTTLPASPGGSAGANSVSPSVLTNGRVVQAPFSGQGMLPDAANAALPSARSNLGLGTANDVIFAGLGVGGATSITLPFQDGNAWDSTGPSQDPRITLFSSFNGTGNAHGFRSYRQFTGTGSTSSFNDFDAFSTVLQAGTDVTAHYAGYEARPNLNTGTTGVSGASLPRATMYQAIPLIGVGSTVTEYESFMSWPNNVQGNVTTGYGFRARSMNTISNPTWAATAWAFYADSDPSFFGGDTDVGNTSYASGVTPKLSVKNTTHQRLFNVGTAVGGGGEYIAGLGSTAFSGGRPTVDDAQLLFDRSTNTDGGGIEIMNSGANNGYGFKIMSPNVASGTAGTRTNDMIISGRSNNATWGELMRFAPNTPAVGIGNSLMAANLSVGGTAGTLRVYNVVTNATDTEYGQFSWSGGVLKVGTNLTGAGSARSMQLMTGGTAALTIDTSQQVSLNAIPTSAGAGGLYVCVDTAGVLYKKAACP